MDPMAGAVEEMRVISTPPQNVATDHPWAHIHNPEKLEPGESRHRFSICCGNKTGRRSAITCLKFRGDISYSLRALAAPVTSTRCGASTLADGTLRSTFIDAISGFPFDGAVKLSSY